MVPQVVLIIMIVIDVPESINVDLLGEKLLKQQDELDRFDEGGVNFLMGHFTDLVALAGLIFIDQKRPGW